MVTMATANEKQSHKLLQIWCNPGRGVVLIIPKQKGFYVLYKLWMVTMTITGATTPPLFRMNELDNMQHDQVFHACKTYLWLNKMHCKFVSNWFICDSDLICNLLNGGRGRRQRIHLKFACHHHIATRKKSMEELVYVSKKTNK